MNYQNSILFAKSLDEDDSLSSYRKEFHYPEDDNGNQLIYLCGNSLGLQPKSASDQMDKEFSIWSKMGVLGQEERWIAYHERLTKPFANLVGCRETEVVAMNALTVNIHFLLISFYNPNKKRIKILMEKDAFPSDQYAIQSQIELHGFETKDALIEIAPREGEKVLRDQDIIDSIEKNSDELALIYLGGLNYYTGQAFDMKSIASLGRSKGIMVGFNLAHSAGNVPLELHDWGVDFAAWCTYKYLCGGPGSPAGIFIHDRHHDWKGHRLLGWWGHDKESRFEMSPYFNPIPTAEAWQISNAPIMGMAPLISSMEIFDKVGMKAIHRKGMELSSYMEYLLKETLPQVSIITPINRGCQLSIIVPGGREIFDFLIDNGVVCDWRNPDVIRVAPHPLFNSFTEIFKFVKILKKAFDR
tara:strand:- start:1589 stop:2830 length:1242 start_codon:yes stop_codon:yes gene_type:complete